MGSRSSFVLASLTHHVLIQHAYFKAFGSLEGVKDSYVIIGDDISIFSEPLSKEVLKIYERIDVQVSTSKTKVPEPGLN